MSNGQSGTNVEVGCNVLVGVLRKRASINNDFTEQASLYVAYCYSVREKQMSTKGNYNLFCFHECFQTLHFH